MRIDEPLAISFNYFVRPEASIAEPQINDSVVAIPMDYGPGSALSTFNPDKSPGVVTAPVDVKRLVV